MIALDVPLSGSTASRLELEYPAHVAFPSSQIEHVPFGFWIVEALRPKTIASLGVDEDDNLHGAFLQAVQALGLTTTTCIGVSFDSAASASSTEADALKSDTRAPTASKLVHATPDGAVREFSDNSIDLLLIPLAAGSASHPVDDWLPKMSMRGVILLHGIAADAERAQSMWARLSARYPSFAFSHAGGLGLLYLGSDAPSGSAGALLRAGEGGKEKVRTYFSRLGASITERHALRRAEDEITALKAELSSHQLAMPGLQVLPDSFARVAAQRNAALRVLRQQTLAAMRPKRESIVFSKHALWARLVQNAPQGLKRVIPLSIKHHVLRILTPDEEDAFSNYSFTGSAAEIDLKLNAQIRWLQPYFSSVGLDDDPAVTFLALRTAGYPVYVEKSDAERVARIVESSGLFDKEYYASSAGDIGDLDPILHYVIVGERMGYAPSERFDPTYYYERYPDLRRSFACLLSHYVTSGMGEGRRPTSLAATVALDRRRIDPTRETVLVTIHEASRTGAPILGYNIVKRLRQKYNVVTLLLSSGDINAAFDAVSSAVVGPLRRQDWHPVEADHLIRRMLSTYKFSYVIANSIDSRIVMRPLACAFVPVIALVHEFASYLSPEGEMGRELGWATQSVFSANRVLDSARAEYPNIDNYRIHILPQGPPELPPAETKGQSHSQQSLESDMRPAGWENAFVVLGCGTIYPRKGVDLFVECAAAVKAQNPARRIRFVWIGQVLPPDLDKGYFPKLLKQIERAGLADNVAIIGEVSDLEPAYRLADAFFLSSRLDPLPNVAIDSALRGLPVICFENCSGISDILATDPVARATVVRHLDTEGAAKLVLQLAANETMRLDIGAALRRLAEATFNMERYIDRLDEIGRESIVVMQQRQEDYTTIEADESFDTISFLGPDSEVVTREDAVRLFIAKAAMLGTGRHPTANFYYRRPCPGFHPQIYAHENRNSYDISLINPLAHFIRSGKPAGPWSHEVILPDSVEKVQPVRLRTALHVHFHYPELCEEFLAMMALNRSRCDLILTTNNRRKARALTRFMENYDRGDVQIIVVPNRGRDIGAFVTGLGPEVLDKYDILGHLHSKRSLFLDDRLIGERWRRFIWTNLLGQQQPMMDIVLTRMANDPGLGIVFPDDPHLSDWDYNLGIAEHLAQRMGMKDPLPPFFNFPVGTMFWARSAALAPLFKLGIDWDSYPKEPAPIDGTILHALERMLPFVAQHAGYRFATTHVPGTTW